MAQLGAPLRVQPMVPINPIPGDTSVATEVPDVQGPSKLWGLFSSLPNTVFFLPQH